MDWLKAQDGLFRGISRYRQLLFGLVFGLTLTLSSTSLLQVYRKRKRVIDFPANEPPRPIELRSDEILDGIPGLIGNTPLVRINSLSNALGVEILGKAEAINQGNLKATHHRYHEAIIMPDDVADEKAKALLALGAKIEKVRPASIVDKKQFVNLAKQRALDFGSTDIMHSVEASTGSISGDSMTDSSTIIVRSTANKAEVLGVDRSPNDELQAKPRGFFADQFENRSNFEAHYDGTGPEIWRQTNGNVQAFVSGAGTGGTIAGTGKYLKDMDEKVLVVLSDPEGSGLHNKIKYGVMYDEKEREGTKRRHQVDTVVEGIGINRLTNNFELALPFIDDAFRITDAEAVSMSRYLVLNDGLFLGSSSACNLFACVKLVKKMGWHNGERIVTILCDSGSRHYSKFWNDDYLRKANIPVDTSIVQDALNASTI